MHESLKAIQVSIDYNAKMIAMLKARHEREDREAKIYSTSNDEDLKTLGSSPIIYSLFRNAKYDKSNDNNGIGEVTSLAKRHPISSESDKSCAEIDKSGLGEVQTLGSITSTILHYKDFNYDNCSITECIALLQSMMKSPNAYDQNKAFTKHIVEALIKANEEKLELEVSIPRKLDDG